MKSIHNSWYKYELTDDAEINYLELLKKVFKVKRVRSWVPYEPTPHQLKFHSDCIIVQQENAMDRLVVKCRQAAFSTDAMMDAAMVATLIDSHVIPVVKLTKPEACVLINLCYELIMNSDGDKYSINGKTIFDKEYIKKHSTKSEIKFPNGSAIRAFPANAKAAENIRGYRIIYGIIDEANFCEKFEDILQAMQDADAGSDSEGKSLMQLNIGTTLKGQGTKFFAWYRKLEKEAEELGFVLYKLPVFDLRDFNVEKSILNQKHCVQLVPWLTYDALEKKRKRNILKFKEEYLAMTVPDEAQLIPLEEVQACERDYLDNDVLDILSGVYLRIGIDFGTTSDLTGISIFQKTDNGIWRQVYLETIKSMILPLQEQHIESLFKRLLEQNCTFFALLDMTGIGASVSQSLMLKFPGMVKGVWFSESVELNKVRMPIKKRLYDNLRDVILDKKVHFIPDEMQQNHLCGITVTYDLSSADEGHGDLAPANALALIPKNYKKQSDIVKTEVLKKHWLEEDKDVNYEDGDFTDINSKINWLKKNGE